MNKRILVTGAAGFIGSNLVDLLLSSGVKVMGIDNFDPYYSLKLKEGNIAEALRNKAYMFQRGDIRDTSFIDDCISRFRPDLLIHLAAKAGVRPSILQPQEYYDVNVMGTLNILEMMKKNKVDKMLFASSSSVYGNNSKVPFSETDNVDNPISPYAASKKAGELLCHTYHHIHDMNIFCLRFFTVYGPRQRPDLAINKFTRAILDEKEITIYGDGTTSRDYTHIDDILQGILKAAEDVEGFDVFNLGESETIQLKDLVSVLEKYAGKKAKLKFLPMQDGDVNQTYADITKARKKLGYNPQIDFDTGIKRFVDWCIETTHYA